MNKETQSIAGLEAAYFAVYHRTLESRVIELVKKYSNRIDAICTELNPDNTVPCFWSLSELHNHYDFKHFEEDYNGVNQ